MAEQYSHQEPPKQLDTSLKKSDWKTSKSYQQGAPQRPWSRGEGNVRSEAALHSMMLFPGGLSQFENASSEVLSRQLRSWKPEKWQLKGFQTAEQLKVQLRKAAGRLRRRAEQSISLKGLEDGVQGSWAGRGKDFWRTSLLEQAGTENGRALITTKHQPLVS